MTALRLKLGLASLMVLAATGCAPSAVPASPPTRPSVATSTPSAFRPSTPADGSAPHQAENNSWKERHTLTAQERREGKALTTKIRPALSALRSSGTITPEATETALTNLGIDPNDVTAKPFRAGPTSETPPPGSFFAVKFGGAGCVLGSLRTDRLDLEVTGAAAEFGCLEPFTH